MKKSNWFSISQRMLDMRTYEYMQKIILRKQRCLIYRNAKVIKTTIFISGMQGIAFSKMTKRFGRQNRRTRHIGYEKVRFLF